MVRQGLLIMWVRYILLTMLACGLIAPPLHARNNIEASLVSETPLPAAGSTVMLAIAMRPKPGWHGYWKNPGDAGFAARLDWTLPKGAKIGAVRFPVPERLIIAGLMNHVFNGDHALLVPFTVPNGLAPGTSLPIRLKGDWLACTDKICVPERAELSADLVVGDGRIAAVDRATFDGWRALLPRPLGAQATFAVTGDQIRIAIPYPAGLRAKEPWFFAETQGALAYPGPQTVSREGDLLIIDAKAAGSGPVAILDGVLAFGSDMGLEVSALPGPVPVGATGFDASTLWLALGGALLGGLLLNIMPCVFPIISLKALSLARAGGDARGAKRDALAYAVGVILTCLAMGGLLLLLRAGGASVGWAFQLQDPRVILMLLLLVSAIALNLAGTFELRGFGGGQELVDRGGIAGSFWTGALAAFVATPCSGPFMAAALGAALVLPKVAALAVFAGLGLAVPFLLLGFVPALRRIIPKPGAWMGRFQRILSVPMFLTAAALLWLLWRQTGQAGLVIGAVTTLVGAAILWLFGRKQPMSFILLLAAVIGIAAAAAQVLPAAGTGSKPGNIAGAWSFSEVRLNALRTAGRPVFVYFTADWCITCKVNEKAAIEQDVVAKAFKEKKVAVMVGDWTNGDPAISRFIESHGRSGVPLYLFYRPGVAEPQVLPQILTPAMLVALAR